MKKIIAASAAAAVAVLAFTGCTSDEFNERKEKQNATTLDNSLGMENQKERLQREEDPNAVRYVYLMNFGQIVGYYVIQGKVSASSTQLAPEQDIIRWNGEMAVVDSAKDDGTFGSEDGGAFFFTADGVLVETDLNYIQSDAPIAIDVPRLGG